MRLRKSLLIAMAVLFLLGISNEAFSQEQEQHYVGDTFYVVGRPSAKMFVDGVSVGEIRAGYILFMDQLNDEWFTSWFRGQRVQLRRQDVASKNLVLQKVESQIEEEMSVDDLRLLSELKLRLDYLQEGLELAEQAYQKQPNDLDTKRLMGLAFERNGKIEEAQKLFEEILIEEPNDFLTWHYLGNCHFTSEAWDEAIACFEKCVSLEPNWYIPYVNLATCHFEQDDVESFIRLLKKAETMDPADLSIQQYLAFADLANDRVTEAMQQLDKILAKNPNYLPVVALKARCLFQNNQFEPCFQLLNRGYEVDPRHNDIGLYLTYYLSSCPEPKFRDGERAVEIGLALCERTMWRRAFAVQMLAAAYAENDEFDRALGMLDKSTESFYGSESLERYLRYLFENKKKFREDRFSKPL